jgi:hypothetical protein
LYTIFYSKSYHHFYVGKNTITYWYFCSQRKILASKPRKHQDSSKQRDTLSKERFNCNGVIKIAINEAIKIAKVTLQHDSIHAQPKTTIIPQNIKDFIKENIDLLPREIYARLVDKGLDLSIRQKQIHFWWTQLGQIRYKRHENAFESAKIWLREEQYQVILEEIQPVHALAIVTGFYEHFKKMEIEIHECGIDATCK